MSSAADAAARLPPEIGPFAGAWRGESWAGEVRVNLVRLAALLVFYAHHLVNVAHSPDDLRTGGAYHLSATALVMIWATGVVVLYRRLAQHWNPPALKYVVTLWDIVLITTLVMLAGTPESPLVILYFLVIAAAPLRLSRALVYLATLGSIAGYLFLLGHYVYVVIGAERYYASPELRIPRAHEGIFVLGLGAAGILAGQVVRQVRRLIRSCGMVVGGQSLNAQPAFQTAQANAESEVRWDTRLVGVGLVLLAILVAIGFILSLVYRPAEDVGGPPLWLIVLVGAVFLAAVVAAVMELVASSRGITSAPQASVPGTSAPQSSQEKT